MHAFGRLSVITTLVLLGVAVDARGECVAVGSRPMTGGQLRSHYDLIFSGVVRSTPGVWPMGGPAETVFLVDQAWKGKVTREMTLLVQVADTSPPKRDRALLVLARRCRDCKDSDKIYRVEGPCTPGIELSTPEAQKLLLSLGSGKPPEQ